MSRLTATDVHRQHLSECKLLFSVCFCLFISVPLLYLFFFIFIWFMELSITHKVYSEHSSKVLE